MGTFDVKFVGRTVTVVRNGVTTIDHQEIEGITGGALDANEGRAGSRSTFRGPPRWFEVPHIHRFRAETLTVRLVQFHAKPNCEKQLMQALISIAEPTRAEPGCIEIITIVRCETRHVLCPVRLDKTRRHLNDTRHCRYDGLSFASAAVDRSCRSACGRCALMT